MRDDPNAPGQQQDPNAPRPDREPDLPQPAGGALLPPAPGAPPPAAPPIPEPETGGAPPMPGGVDEPVSRVPRDEMAGATPPSTVGTWGPPAQTGPAPPPPAAAAPPPPEPPRSYWAAPPEDRPRGPAPGFVYGGFWIRLVAFLVDLVPLLIISGILLAPVMSSFFTAISDIPRLPPGTEIDSPEYEAWQRLVSQRMTTVMTQITPVSGLLQLISAAYFIGFWTWRGQTPGMMLFGLRVARESDGAPPGLARSILRYVGYIVSQIVLFIGFIWIAFDSRKQGWHDKIAGTVVVRRTG